VEGVAKKTRKGHLFLYIPFHRKLRTQRLAVRKSTNAYEPKRRNNALEVSKSRTLEKIQHTSVDSPECSPNFDSDNDW